ARFLDRHRARCARPSGRRRGVRKVPRLRALGGRSGRARLRGVTRDRVLSLAVDEPASDFTDDGDAVYGWPEFDGALLLPPAESTAAFMRLQVADDVILPAPPAGNPPPW